MRRRVWFEIHSWVGVNLGLLLIFVLLTGTLACVSRELDWLFVPEMRAKTSVPITQLKWDAMLENFHDQFPDDRPLQLQAPIARWLAPELIGVTQENTRFRVFFDAQTGAVQGASAWFNWQRFLRESHRHLMLPVTIGLTIVGGLAISLIATMLSSLYIYKHWWRGFFRVPTALHNEREKPNDGKSKRRFWGGIHRLAGVWSLWFVLLMATTGAWYLAERWGFSSTFPPSTVLTQTYSSAPSDSLAQKLEIAKELYPELLVQTIRFDSTTGRTLLQGQAQASFVRDRANQIVFHEGDDMPIELRRGDELDWHSRISEAADPLHFGTFGGSLTRFIWALFGALLTVLAVTGVYLHGLRLVARTRHEVTKDQPLVSALKRIPLLWSAPSLAVIAFCLSRALIETVV